MRILLGMSGGFDSSLSAKKLLDEGHTVIGACLVMHDYTDTDAPRAVCEMLGIPLYVVDCRSLFDSIVMEDFAREYSRGRTPNPCVLCNRTVKFRMLYELAKELSCDTISTGHYARLVDYTFMGHSRRTFALAEDTKKDQTYMLYRLPGEIIDMLYFPLAESVKSELRRDVEGTELAFLDKDDSQEICFLPNGDYPAFVEERVGYTKGGNFVDDFGKVLGAHNGIIHYTIGQRKGLGISLGERVFVTDIDAVSGNITLSQAPRMTNKVYLTDVLTPAIDSSVITDDGVVLDLCCKVRYAAPMQKATIKITKDGRAEVILKEPARSVTPGQSLVFYDGDILIGGGIIDRVE